MENEYRKTIYYRKGVENRTHQIHAFEENDENLIRHFAFRDYLIHHKIIADKYGELKLRAAQICNNDIETYCGAKEDSIKHYEEIALKWYAPTKHSS